MVRVLDSRPPKPVHIFLISCLSDNLGLLDSSDRVSGVGEPAFEFVHFRCYNCAILRDTRSSKLSWSDLELGLPESEDISLTMTESRYDSENLTKRDERDIDRDEIIGYLTPEISDIRLLVEVDTSICPETRMELIRPDIDGCNTFCSVIQEYLTESSSRRSDIESYLSIYGDLYGSEKSSELACGSSDPSCHLVFSDLDSIRFFDEMRWLRDSDGIHSYESRSDEGLSLISRVEKLLWEVYIESHSEK